MSEHFPRQFGKYVLLKSLARGGMGEIYLAASGQPGGLNKLCVIKKVIAGKTDRAKVNRFLDEAKVVLRLSHGNLVSTFDAGDVGGELFIAMELVEGKDLREIWNRCVRTRTRIPVDVALVTVREVARALAYVHSYSGLRLVHRDVAPPNILLSYFGEVKLTDFGLARSALKQEHTAPGVVFGRASYLAPEQARGEVADARTDVYSLGIVLWELLTGQPYLQLAGLDPVTSLSLVRHPKPQPPSARAPWITPELDGVALRALAADRTNRFQSAEELRRALSDVMSRVAPRADAERVAEFLRGLYHDVVVEESAERERLLNETLPLYRGDRLPDASTPRTDVFPPPAGGSAQTSGRRGEASAAAGDSGGPKIAVAAAAVSRIMEMPKESLHVSAARARAGSQARPAPGDSAVADAPTKIWRKDRRLRSHDAAQTFVGRVIDNRYRIHRRIGEGGMGTVYAAEHVDIGKSVAVKILHRIFSGEEQLVERFRREARAASRVGHPHIIEVTDFGTTEEGCAYFVMELLEGMDLADILMRDGRLDSARAARIAAQICQALEAAHASGIIHRDLKPENIFLVARDGQADFVKVLDFGIARNLSGESRRLTNPGMAMGTPEYMAPEQSQGKPADRRSDVYAVGALLHEMVMGVAPFQAETQQEMLEAKQRPLESLRALRPEIPASLEAVILRALAPDPERRPQTMALLEYELGKIVWGRPQAVADLLGLKENAAEPLESETLGRQGGGDSDLDAEEVSDGTQDGDGSAGHLTDAAIRSGNGAPPAARSIRATETIDPNADTETPPPPPLFEPVRRTGSGTGRVSAHAHPHLHPPLAKTTRPATATSDFERLLEADLTPEPQVGSGTFSAAGSAPGSWSSGLMALGARDETNERTLGVDSDDRPSGRHAAKVLVPAPSMVSSRQRSFGWLIVPLVAGVVGGSGWIATNGPPELARGWITWLRARVPGRVASSVSPAVPRAPAAGPWLVPVRNGQIVPRPDIALAADVTVAARAASRPAPSEGEASPSSLPSPSSAPASASPSITATAPESVGVGTVSSSSPAPVSPHGAPEIVQMPPLESARTALAAGLPDDAIVVLRAAAAGGNASARPMLADALVASGWNDVKAYRWNTALRKAREALALCAAAGSSRGSHALLGEAAYALGDFNAALGEFTKALAESPRDARLKRRVIRSRRQLHRPANEQTEDTDSLTSEATPE